jgi:hypothetical protein
MAMSPMTSPLFLTPMLTSLPFSQQKGMLLENEQRCGFLLSLLGGVVKIMRRVKRSNFRPAS